MFSIYSAQADVIVTPAVQAQAISADQAAGSRTSSFAPIGDIVISEQMSNDFAYTDRYWRTLILTAPEGWEFNPESGKASTSARTDFRVVALKMSVNTITIRFCIKSTDVLDVLTISGIEVKAISGLVKNSNAFVYRSAYNPGTAMVSNITMTRNQNGSGGTNFATLGLRPGKADKLVFSQKPYSSEVGEELAGHTSVVTVDQFGNFSTEGLPENLQVKLRISGAKRGLSGQLVRNIGTRAGNGVARFEGLSIAEAGMMKLVATAPGLSFAVTGDFIVYQDGEPARASGVDPDLMCVR